MLKPTLNLGCGNDMWGDERMDIVKTKATNIIMDFDKYYLPWENKYFSECRLFHVLEHSKNPQRLLNEAIRVSDKVHAKFPYRWDRIPFVLRIPLHWNGSWGDVFAHNCSLLFGKDHPLRHRWMIQPFGTCKLNKIEIFNSLHLGRKEKLFRILPKIEINAEWECIYIC